MIREDLLDLSRTHEISLIEAAIALLPDRVGSPFSMQSFSEDLEISHPTAKRWIDWLSALFYLYRVLPYGRNVARALKKQPKLYLWDWSEIQDDGARFENFIASHLLKAVHFWTDNGTGTFELNYIRDKEKREVNFLVLRDRKPWMMVECKLSDHDPSLHLKKFATSMNPELALQVVWKSGVHERFALSGKTKGFVISADSFLKLLP